MSKYPRNEGRTKTGIHVKDAFQILLITFGLVPEKKNYWTDKKVKNDYIKTIERRETQRK